MHCMKNECIDFEKPLQVCKVFLGKLENVHSTSNGELSANHQNTSFSVENTDFISMMIRGGVGEEIQKAKIKFR